MLSLRRLNVIVLASFGYTKATTQSAVIVGEINGAMIVGGKLAANSIWQWHYASSCDFKGET